MEGSGAMLLHRWAFADFQGPVALQGPESMPHDPPLRVFSDADAIGPRYPSKHLNNATE